MDHLDGKSDSKRENEDLVFFVRVQYRRNTSWQGTIQWMDGKKSGVFRSVLELGSMIDDAKNKKAGKNKDSGCKWKNKDNVS